MNIKLIIDHLRYLLERSEGKHTNSKNPDERLYYSGLTSGYEEAISLITMAMTDCQYPPAEKHKDPVLKALAAEADQTELQEAINNVAGAVFYHNNDTTYRDRVAAALTEYTKIITRIK